MKITILIITSIFFTLTTKAQTILPGGTVNGVWTIAGSPYLVQGNLLIPNGTLLTIQPGVRVIFNGSYKLLVSGRLVAIGTVADSIRFTAADVSTGWQGIRFESTASTNDSSQISFCTIQSGFVDNDNGGGIYVNGFSKLAVTHSSIMNCTARGGLGGAIYLFNANVLISDNNISFNHSLAGGIYIFGGNPLIRNNFISQNDNEMPPVEGPGDPNIDPDNSGGGISCSNSSAVIDHNTITYNKSKGKGGGIWTDTPGLTISNNNISYNYAALEGGGMHCGGGLIKGNNISNNSTQKSGGGVFYFGNGNLIFDRNNVLNNSAVEMGGGMACFCRTDTITNNIISNNFLTNPTQFYQGGGGIWLMNCDTSTIFSNNVITNNTAVNGGGILCYLANPAMLNNTIANNSSTNGGALYCSYASPVFKNTLLWGNGASAAGSQIYLYDNISDPLISFSDIQGGSAAFATNGGSYTGAYQNNISSNPLFVSPSGGSGTTFNGAIANWSLQNGSPCINTGKPGENYLAQDFAGNIRLISNLIDMGAIENQTGIPPTAIVSGGGQACIGLQRPPIVFTFTNGTFPLILQYKINGVTQALVTGISSLQYIINNPPAGIYTVYSITDPVSTGSGSGTATVTVIQPMPAFTVNNNTQCLQGNNVIFTNTSSINYGTLSYSWNFGDGSPVDTSTNTNHHYANAGSYVTSLIVTGSNGCKGSFSYLIRITNFTINPFQDSMKIYLDSTVLNAGAGFVSYHWNTGDTTQSIAVKQTGWYKVTVTNSSGCSAKDSSFINFRKNKTLFIDTKTNICSSSFNLSVRTKNISNVVGLQGTISWNPNLVKLMSIIYDSSAIRITPQDINFNTTPNGYLTFSWLDNSLAGKSTPDSTKLFTLNFSKYNFSGAVTMPVTFNSSYTALEIDTINTLTGTASRTSESAFINGAASLLGSVPTSFLSFAACDSVVYNGKIFYASTRVTDTIRYVQGGCDSVYKVADITVYTAVTPTVNITVSQNGITYGNTVSFNASTTFGGQLPLFQWYKNGVLINGVSGNIYTAANLNAGDTIYVKLKSSFSCAVTDTILSNKIGMNVYYLVSGQVKNPLGTTISNVILNLSGKLNTSFNLYTSPNYSINIPGGYSYVIRPDKNNDINKTNGVSTLDIALIQGHILNTTLLNSPYKLIAADVNNSGNVSAIDILYIKRLILGLDNTFPGNRLWAFADTSNGNFNALFPLPYPDSISLVNLKTPKTNQSFIGVKLGDVNFDWNASLLRPQQPLTKPILFYYNDVKAAEDEIKVPIRVKDFKDVLGMQFTLNFNSDVLELKRIENKQLNIQYALIRSGAGMVPFIWNDPSNNAVTLKDDDVLMELIFVKKSSFIEEDIKITSDITIIEAWDGTYNKHNIEKGTGKILSLPQIASFYTKEDWSVTPNPSQGIVQVSFKLIQSRNISFELFNEEGKKVMSQNLFVGTGVSNTSLNLQKDKPLAAGIYYLKASGIEGNNIRKLIIIK